jgi:hypothetical protein
MTLKGGRKWHFELSSAGGVGLAQSNRLALDESDRPLLLLEDDFKMHDCVRFTQECKTLLTHLDAFDVACFGVSFRGRADDLSAAEFMSDAWQFATGQFFFTHCVMYSPRGRSIVRRWLLENPLDMQIDGLLGSLAQMGRIKLLLQTRRASVKQHLHVSQIQHGTCVLCDVDPKITLCSLIKACIIVVSAALALVAYHRRYTLETLRAAVFHPHRRR